MLLFLLITFWYLPKHPSSNKHDDNVLKVQCESKYNHSQKRQNVNYQSSLSKTKQNKIVSIISEAHNHHVVSHCSVHTVINTLVFKIRFPLSMENISTKAWTSKLNFQQQQTTKPTPHLMLAQEGIFIWITSFLCLQMGWFPIHISRLGLNSTSSKMPFLTIEAYNIVSFF